MMIIKSLNVSDFRSYRTKSFQFSPQVTVVVGPNGSGKTNLLEALVTVATGRSFRAGYDREMVRWGNEFSRVTVHTGDAQLELLITVGTVSGRHTPSKRYKVNGVARRAVDFIGQFRAVLFWPEDLELVTDSPSIRRKYLDRVLVQADREYRRNLASYERGVRQRNSLLDQIAEGQASRSQLLFWNQLLIRSGGYITETRARYIDFVTGTGSAELPYKLEYDKSVISESRLAQYADAEIAAKSTLVGPHRDDFRFFMTQGGAGTAEQSVRDLTIYGSRGEQRLAVLWLKLAELSYLQQEVGDRPTLLLDDIFSELDDVNRQRILDIIGRQQTIITSADAGITELFGKSEIPCKMVYLAEHGVP